MVDLFNVFNANAVGTADRSCRVREMVGMSAMRRRNSQVLERNGAPGRIRTCDPRLRRPIVGRGLETGPEWLENVGRIGYTWRLYPRVRGLSAPTDFLRHAPDLGHQVKIADNRSAWALTMLTS